MQQALTRRIGDRAAFRRHATVTTEDNAMMRGVLFATALSVPIWSMIAALLYAFA